MKIAYNSVYFSWRVLECCWRHAVNFFIFIIRFFVQINSMQVSQTHNLYVYILHTLFCSCAEISHFLGHWRDWRALKACQSDFVSGQTDSLITAYRNTSPNSCATIRWIGVGEGKNVTPTPISNGLPDSTRGGYHTWVSCRWYGVIIVSIHGLGTIIWAKTYPFEIHLQVSLNL